MFNVIVNFFSELEWVGGRFVHRGPEWAEISSAHYPQTHLPTLKEVMVDSPPCSFFWHSWVWIEIFISKGIQWFLFLL